MHDSPAGRGDRPRVDDRHARPRADDRLAHLITELQGRGLRVEVPLESRQGGAGPADAGMLWVDGFAATVPTGAQDRKRHTSELQSHSDLVCRLLLEKKKKIRFILNQRIDTLYLARDL